MMTDVNGIDSLMTVWTVSRNEMKTGAGMAQYMASSDYRPSI